MADARKMLGAFQFNIPVNADAEILPFATRNLSILRFIHQTIPATSRWNPIFTREPVTRPTRPSSEVVWKRFA